MEVVRSEWDRYYEKGCPPWTTGGISGCSKELLARYSKGRDLLEVGCGIGVDLRDLSKLGYNIHGIDISERAIALASSRLPNVTLMVADFFQWTPPKLFNVVYDRGVFHNLGTPLAREQFALRVSSVLSELGIWMVIAGAADGERSERSHGGMYLQDLVLATEPYFEFLEVRKDRYGLIDISADFPAWHCVLARR